MCISTDEDFVTLDIGPDNLSSDVAIGEADNQTVFSRVILVLSLRNQALACIVVGLAGAASFVLGLEATTMAVRKINRQAWIAKTSPGVRPIFDLFLKRLAWIYHSQQFTLQKRTEATCIDLKKPDGD